MKTILTAMFSMISSMNPVFTTIGVVGVSLVALFNWVSAEWALMLTKIDLLAQQNFGGTLPISPLGFLDTFIPLTETLSLFTIWLGVLALASTIRIIKSFIPTIAT